MTNTGCTEHDVDTAIDESKRTGETVHLRWSEAAFERLLEECEDRDGDKFWGIDLDDVTWHVELDIKGAE